MRIAVIQIFLLLYFPLFLFSQKNPHGEFQKECTDCHSATSWSALSPAMKFNHSTTGFPLDGKHKIVDCKSCHQSLVFSSAKNDCISCHTEPHQQTLGVECAQCHTSSTWQVLDMMQKHNQFRFALAGVHKLQDCNSCHASATNFLFSGASLECASCHKTDYAMASNPLHAAMNLSVECSQCHTQTSKNWSAELFRHKPMMLEGVHKNLQCNQCHTGSGKGFSQECAACHKENYNTAPNHLAQHFPENCTMCHNSVSWNQTTFNHSNTNFPLVGSHVSVQCFSCHTGGFPGTSSQCISCHQSNYNTAVNHVAQSYPTNCAMCHSSTAWNQTSFNHSTTNFPLVGVHNTTQCGNCHINGFTGTPTQCYSCHQLAYQQSGNPNHSAAGISHECQTCHIPDAWIPSSFNHTTTGFSLTGAHINRQCSSCHIGTTSGASPLCFSCHQDDYNGAEDHLAQGYPTTCETCHNTTEWEQVTFNHTATNFPLTGAHINTSCSNCHSGGFAGTTTLCNECHNADYQASVNPNHIALAIPTTCNDCHNTNNDWQPASFAIHNNYFQLVGAHTSVNNCATCHNGDYNNTPNTCYGCHQTDFTQTTDPPHQQLNFSHECLTCHQSSQTLWTPATFNHNFYPIGSRHNNVNCNECHSQSNYLQQCLSCHLEDFLDEHEQGFRTDCWSCHNTDDWNDGLKHRIKKNRIE